MKKYDVIIVGVGVVGGLVVWILCDVGWYVLVFDVGWILLFWCVLFCWLVVWLVSVMVNFKVIRILL